MMAIHSVYIVSKSGGMIFNYDHNFPKVESEKTFNFPMDLKLELRNKKLVVVFGQRDGICIGQTLLSINGTLVNGGQMESGPDALEYLDTAANFPVSLRFGRTRMTTNEKMFLGSMFYPLYAIASQISPEPHSSGIQVLEAETFKLHCLQTLTGVKFIAICDPRLQGMEIILRKIYELYADYVLKNPFYALEMPIRCDLFNDNLKVLLETIERTGITNV